MRSEEVRLEFSNLSTLFSELKAYAAILYNSENYEKFCIQIGYSTRTYPDYDMNYILLYEHDTRDAIEGRIKMIDYWDCWNAFGFAKCDDSGTTLSVNTISTEMLQEGIFRNPKMVNYFISLGAYKEGQTPYWLSFTRVKKKQKKVEKSEVSK